MTASVHTADPNRLLGMTGLEAMRALMTRQLEGVSIAKTLNYWLTEVDDGRAVFEGEPTAAVLNPLGIVHGGWALTLIDSACGCAVHTTLPPGVGYTSLETKVNFTRAITPETGRVRCEGLVVARGRTILTAEARLTDGRNRLLAHGSSTLMALRPDAR
ncbi:MAG: PaaI family thioesterase [Hyphomonadaceae bacterium]|nr:PaaI family thioesterase [Hyphomonadaceae bacterium]